MDLRKQAGGRVLGALLVALSLACNSVTPSDDMAQVAAEQQEMLDELNRVSREIQDRVRIAREEGNLLTELEALRTLDAESVEASEMVRTVLALRLSDLSCTIGNHEDALRYADRGEEPYGNELDPVFEESLRNSSPSPAVEAIRQLASSRQVIMLNEAHHDPRHRVVTLELLEVLREEGFEYFAAETLYEDDTDLAQRGYPTAKTGAYTVEPVFGSLVRAALRLGYKVVPYEARMSRSADERERGQAANLQKRILEADPQAKILVHAGYGHIYKSALSSVIPMAVRFQELTGIEPFSVDQTTMTERYMREAEHPLFKLAIEEDWVEGPTLFIRDGYPWSIAPDLHDATLFHPRAMLEQGRPDWLRKVGRRVAYTVPEELVPTGTQALVRAWLDEEPDEAIPFDQVEVRAEGGRPVLLLEPGVYRLVAETASGEAQGALTVEVPEPESN